MKYPQLVSTRAVNAISDWLVSRLEQLGVESPLIYSRLLLSLLQSSVQLNDPIEFNNLETFIANRKGGRYHNLPCDRDTLKKIAAIQCLMDIVSSEQEINNVEDLVDELCKKLTEFEENDYEEIVNNNQLVSEEDNSGVSVASSALTVLTSATKNSSKKPSAIQHKDDSAKRYYNAFPALSREMEDSVRILRNYSKSLTWPADRSNQRNKNVLASSLKQQISSNSKSNFVQSSSNNSSTGNLAGGGSSRGGIKRRTRRRNQGNSKSSSTTSDKERKKSYSSGNSGTWDTDFEGSWEMGRDLIKEFLIKENNKSNRNRSTSESAAYGIKKEMDTSSSSSTSKYRAVAAIKRLKEDPITDKENTIIVNKVEDSIDTVDSILRDDECAKLLLQEPPSLSDEGYSTHENLTMLSDVASDVNNHYLNQTRRLYERDVSNDSLNSSTSDIEQNEYDFAQFKAKFNSNVEALWKESSDVEKDPLEEPSNVTFWAKYYQHHFDEDQATAEDNDPFFSIPSNSTSSIVGCGRTRPMGGFYLQTDSIWSNGENNSNMSYSDSDDLFYAKASSNKSETQGCIQEIRQEEDSGNKSSFNTSFNYDPNSKWSEGINGVSQNATSSNTSIESEVVNDDNPVIPPSTLTNHSITTSAFTEYSLIKPLMGPLIPVAKSGLLVPTQRPSLIEENLLDSPKTHFTPIKQNYPDGFCFPINSEHDEIDYMYSSDGYLLYDNKKFLKYNPCRNRNDTTTRKESVDEYGENLIEEDFILKFQVKATEKSCQTQSENNAVETCSPSPLFQNQTLTQPTNILPNFIDQWSSEDMCKNCTLWGVCSDCNANMPPITNPADHLLKHELNVEGDEIMANLKYLYIGNEWTKSGDEGIQSDDDTEFDADTIRDCVFSPYQAEVTGTDVYYNVTRLISDFLHPDCSKTLNEMRVEDEEIGNGLTAVQDCGGDKIWTMDSDGGGGGSGTGKCDIPWEYSNLAEIWNKSEEDVTKSNNVTSAQLQLQPPCSAAALKKRNISQRLQNFLANASNVTSAVSSKTRKRRHSASQNICTRNNTKNTNNNNNDVSFGNNNSILPEQQQQTVIMCKYWTQKMDTTTDNSLNTNSTLNDYDDENEMIIDNDDKTVSTFFIEKNPQQLASAIALNHSTFFKFHIARPLTR